MPFARGEAVALRQRFRGRLWGVTAAVVVEDSPALLALWMPAGSETMTGRVAGDLLGDWTLEPAPLRGPILRLTRPGEAHSVLHFRHPDGSFRGWYVNLEHPLRRTRVGFDFDDLVLDLWLEPGAEWRWLDEDELEAALARGLLSPAEAALARAEGERVIAANRFPTGWEDWEPDPTWPIPALPAGWSAP